MTELLLPALPLGDPAAIFDPTPHAARRSPIPSSSRLSRIRAFGSGAPEEGARKPTHLGTTPVLAKHVLDGDVPTTVFSSRLDFADDQDFAPVNLFPMARELEEEPKQGHGQKDVVQQIDDRVAKMMQMHLMNRPTWAACTPSRHSPLSPSGLGLSSALHFRGHDAVLDESTDDESELTPDFDAEETADVTKYRREAGAERMVDLFYEITRWQSAGLFWVWRQACFPQSRMRQRRVLLKLQTSISAWLQHVVMIKLARKKANAGERIFSYACQPFWSDDRLLWQMQSIARELSPVAQISTFTFGEMSGPSGGILKHGRRRSSLKNDASARPLCKS